MSTEQEVAQMLQSMEDVQAYLEQIKAKAGGVSPAAYNALAKYIKQGLIPSPYSVTKQITSFGSSAETLDTSFKISTGEPFVWLEAETVQYLTAKDPGGAEPLNTILSNAGFENDGNGNLIRGLNFKFRWSSSLGSRSFDNGFRFSSSLKGKERTLYIPHEAVDLGRDQTITQELKTLGTAAANYTYQGWTTVSGLKMIRPD